ncbi:MAG: lipopolysaccharide biosynthesis protein, partial [Paracoccaceae bacterium]
MNLDLKFLFAVFLRRLPIFVVTFATVAAAALAAAMLLPTVYSASSLLMVESSQIPGALMAPTVQAAALEKLQTMENRLMTRANLLDIANRLKVFKDIDRMTPDEIIQGMRDNTTIWKSANRGEATMMSLAFDASNGRVAAGVVNEYVTIILKDDIDLRTRSAEGTVDFFDQEVKRLGAELDEMSAKILEFQNKNSDALPSTLSFRMSQQNSLQAKLDSVELNISTLKDQRERLVSIYNSTGQVSQSTSAMTPEAQQLASLNDQLTQSLAILSPTHPRIKILQAQIDQLEVIVKSQASASGAVPTDSTSTIFDIQIADLDVQIEAAEKVRDQVQSQMAALQETIDRTPANQIAVDALTRDYANIQQEYNNAVSNQGSAAAAERIEILSKG